MKLTGPEFHDHVRPGGLLAKEFSKGNEQGNGLSPLTFRGVLSAANPDTC